MNAMPKNKKEFWLILIASLTVFFILLFSPLFTLFIKSLKNGTTYGLANYFAVLNNKDTLLAFKNSLLVSFVTACISTCLAFVNSYTISFTKINSKYKKLLEIGIMLPMLLPTITYGFAIIYSFGKQGLITRTLATELFSIYGFGGILLGYVIYTTPCAFVILHNAFSYIDKRFLVISSLMRDSAARSFFNTVLRPLLPSICGAFVVSFILSFTDFGIPASLGGNYTVIATELYQIMLGSIPDFGAGASVAMLMLLPAVFCVLLLNYIEKFNFHYDSTATGDLQDNKIRDFLFLSISLVLVGALLMTFAVMFVMPIVKNYPYDMTLSTVFLQQAFSKGNLLQTYKNSLYVASMTACAGTLFSYSAALLSSRSNLPPLAKKIPDVCAIIANTVPGMVLGLGYLLFFNNSDFKTTFAIIIACNILHFFTTPYLMAKNALSKLNPAWETTGELMGDSWIKTVGKVIVPNSVTALANMWSYYFINAMVTVSAIIFLVTARTSVITSQIKEFQHYGNFNEIFVLSILILFTNIFVKIGIDAFVKYYKKT